MKLIVGLGNPGAKYKNTYHNVGFMTVDAVAKKLKVRFSKTECEARTAKGIYKGEEYVLAKPETFMNASGVSVKQLLRAYDVDERDGLVVCYDDADLPLGKTRFREEGSAGTHNGMRSIVAELNRTDFKRMRIGIKTEELAQKQVELIELVLSKVDYENKLIIEKSVDAASDAILDVIAGVDAQRIEEKINRKK